MKADPSVVLAKMQAKVEQITESGCWIWIGSINAYGYGQYSIRGERNFRAHRLLYELLHGPIPAGVILCHTCDVRCCVNPAHLVLGDYKKNMADCVSRGRHKNQNTGKTHCKNGHELSGRNLIIEVTGFRRCRICVNADHLKRYHDGSK